MVSTPSSGAEPGQVCRTCRQTRARRQLMRVWTARFRRRLEPPADAQCPCRRPGRSRCDSSSPEPGKSRDARPRNRLAQRLDDGTQFCGALCRNHPEAIFAAIELDRRILRGAIRDRHPDSREPRADTCRVCGLRPSPSASWPDQNGQTTRNFQRRMKHAPPDGAKRERAASGLDQLPIPDR
jgi:hypothetical protein